MTVQEKYEVLKKELLALERVAIAFSSGVDSTFLLKTAHDLLGDGVIAVTARSCSFPERELQEAREFCEEEGITHLIVDSEELDIAGFSSNPPNRCYLCKRELFEKIGEAAKSHKITAIAEGSNTDDNGDYRPGLTAVAEMGIHSPLRKAGLSKEEIRELSHHVGLRTWDKQSFACLSSRFVYGQSITREKLQMVDKAEQLLLDLGFHQVRVRVHDTIARIEVLPEEFLRLVQDSVRKKITEYFKELGFSYVTMDLNGYSMGSMNHTLEIKKY